MQQAAEELAQRRSQLQDDNGRLGSKLAQRDNELQEIAQTVDELEASLEAARREGAEAAGELGALARRGGRRQGWELMGRRSQKGVHE